MKHKAIILRFFNYIICVNNDNINDEDFKNTNQLDNSANIQQTNRFPDNIYQSKRLPDEKKYLCDFIFSNYFDNLKLLFLSEYNQKRLSTSKNELLDIIQNFIVKNKYNSYYYNDNIDFNLQHDVSITLPENIWNDATLDFSQEDDIISQAFNLCNIEIALHNYFDRFKEEFLAEYRETIQSCKVFIISNFLLIKNSIVDELKDFLSTKNTHETYKNKYKSYIIKILNTLTNITKHPKLFDTAKSFAKEGLNTFKSYVKHQMNISLFYTELKIIIKLSKKLIQLNEFISQKIASLPDNFFLLNETELKSLPMSKIIEKESMELFNIKKTLRDLNAKQIICENKITEATEVFNKSNKKFFLEKHKKNYLIFKLNHLKSSNLDDFYTKKLKNKLNCAEFTYLNALEINIRNKNCLDQLIKSYWDFIEREQIPAEEKKCIKEAYLQFIQKKIQLKEFLNIFLTTNINFSMSLIGKRMSVWKNLLKNKQQIFIEKQYKFIRRIVSEKQVIQKLIENELNLIKILKKEDFLNQLKTFEDILKSQDDLKPFALLTRTRVFFDELNLKRAKIATDIVFKQIFLEHKLKQFCLSFLNSIYKDQNIEINNSLHQYDLIIKCFTRKILLNSKSFSMFLLNMQNTRILLIKSNKEIELMRVVLEHDVLKNELFQMKPFDHRIRLFIKKLLKNLILEIDKTHIEFLNLIESHKKYSDIIAEENISYWLNKNAFNLAILNFNISCETITSLRMKLNKKLLQYDTNIKFLTKCLENCETVENKLCVELENINNFYLKISTFWEKITELNETFKRLILESSDSINVSDITDLFQMSKDEFLMNRNMFYEVLKNIFADSNVFNNKIETKILVNNAYDVLTDINILENEIRTHEKNQSSFLKGYYLVVEDEDYGENILYLISKVCSSYIKHVYYIYIMKQFELLHLEIIKLTFFTSKNLLYLKEYYEAQFKGLEFVTDLDLQNANFFYNESVEYVNKINFFYENQEIDFKNDEKTFENTMKLLIIYFDTIYKDPITDKKMKSSVSSFLPGPVKEKKFKSKFKIKLLIAITMLTCLISIVAITLIVYHKFK
ncbi:hypothetical protein NUSPORA_01163 [Nucleospora cyclopteri]